MGVISTLMSTSPSIPRYGDRAILTLRDIEAPACNVCVSLWNVPNATSPPADTSDRRSLQPPVDVMLPMLCIVHATSIVSPGIADGSRVLMSVTVKSALGLILNVPLLKPVPTSCPLLSLITTSDKARAYSVSSSTSSDTATLMPTISPELALNGSLVGEYIITLYVPSPVIEATTSWSAQRSVRFMSFTSSVSTFDGTDRLNCIATTSALVLPMLTGNVMLEPSAPVMSGMDSVLTFCACTPVASSRRNRMLFNVCMLFSMAMLVVC